MFIWNHSIQDSILYRTFQTTDFAAGLQIENFHNFSTIYRRLEISDTVFFLQIFQFLTNQLEVIKEALLTDFILRCNICFAQQHQVINIVTGFEKQASYGRISHFLISNYDRAHM